MVVTLSVNPFLFFLQCSPDVRERQEIKLPVVEAAHHP